MAFAFFAIIALLTGVSSDVYKDEVAAESYKGRTGRSFEPGLLSGCLYEGRWYPNGGAVVTRESCLRCACLRGALSCSRRACAPLPDPPPSRCHVRHRRGSCCPELHCPDVVINMEHEASARSELDDFFDIAPPNFGKVLPACVEGGSIYSAGSAMTSNMACEQCFCLKGARKCVRPNCLPPPPHCVARPTAGACCPQRYYCEHDNRPLKNPYDCEVNGRRVQEGDRVPSSTNCTACFCLKGAVHCQALGCAPPLHGCEPVLRPGECCAHQYNCGHGTLNRGTLISATKADKTQYNTVVSTRMDDRALHAKNMSKLLEITTKKILNEIYTVKNMPIVSATKNDVVSTTKVKRKTDENSLSLNEKPQNKTMTTNATTEKDFNVTKITSETTEITAETTTDQPEGTMKIVINGTINCTAELSSTSLPLNITNDTDRIHLEAIPRIPIVNGIEAQTYSPNDIITDRSVNGDFDENESFTINVTSSLNANPNKTARPMIATTSKPAPVEMINSLNSSKKTKGDYDYDYTEPTLPPSLPNLKIIPFVAADAVVDDESPKEPLTYPILEREDKFPVYYPPEPKETFTRREDLYPTQYPIFVSKKEPVYSHDLGLVNNRYPVENSPVHEYAASSVSHKNEAKTETKATQASSKFELNTPALNLFSPPVETEGGFIPKGPGIIEEYFAVYSSTPPTPVVPHLTTSMQLDISKGECVSDDGQNVPDGESATIECSECICMWGHLNCAPIICQAPTGCQYSPPSLDSTDQCCGDIVCDQKNASNSIKTVTENSAVNINKEDSIKNESIQASVLQKTKPLDDVENRNKTIDSVPQKSAFDTINSTDTFTRNNYTTSKTNITTVTTENSVTYTNMPHVTSTQHVKEINYSSTEYDDDDDEGFSFGSVLKLLLSDTYDSSTKTSNKTPTSTVSPSTKTPLPTTTMIRRPSTTINPFKPLPSLPYIPSNLYPSTVNRIDHLVLGEATAIKKTTLPPITNKTTKIPTEKPTEKPEVLAITSGPKPPNLGGPGLPLGAELFKLAGCNIYGRMYRVGRIIAELSTDCEECWCTEIGVQCNQLGC